MHAAERRVIDRPAHKLDSSYPLDLAGTKDQDSKFYRMQSVASKEDDEGLSRLEFSLIAGCASWSRATAWFASVLKRSSIKRFKE